MAVTVIDDWQGRGLGRVLLTRLTHRARREGVRRFSVVVLGENREAIGLFNSFGDVRRRQSAAGVVELVIELPPKRGIGARLARALREAAGNLAPAQTRAARDAKIGEVDGETTESSSGRSSQERSS